LHAQKIMDGLTREGERWQEMCRGLRASVAFIRADALVIADVLGYLRPFWPAYRALVLADWRDFLAAQPIDFVHNFAIVGVLRNDVKIRD
jgi:hypothetical protein